MKVHRGSRLLLLGAVTLFPAALPAQGFGLNEIGTCAVSRGFATTSGGCRDASLVYWNPAAITTLEGRNGLVGAAPIRLHGEFVQDTTGREYETEAPIEVPPHLFWASRRAGSPLAWGLGVYVPYGLSIEWNDAFPGRFSAKRASIQTVYVQPTLAYRFTDRWSAGVGPIVGHSSVELVQGVDLAQQTLPTGTGTFANLGIPPRTEFARASLEGDAWGFGFTAGFFGKPNDDWQIGIRYLHEIEFDYDDATARFEQRPTGLVIGGDVPNPANPSQILIARGTPVDSLVAPQFRAGGALVEQGVATRIPHPAQVQAGLTYTGFDRTSVTVEYAWLGWKAFKELPVDFETAPDRVLIEDYNNSSAIRFGADRRFANGWTGRVGASAATSAAPAETVTPLLPEQDRFSLSLGAGIPLSAKWTVDAGYGYVGTWGSRGRIDERTSRSQTAQQLNTGWYKLSASIFSLGFKATY